MNDIRNVTIAILALALVAVSGWSISKSSAVKAGAVTGPDIMSPYFSFGGVRQWAAKTDSLTQASTGVICALQSPASTSTLQTNSSIRLSVSSTTATTLTIYKATTSAPTLALATILATSSVSANAQALMIAATTTPVADSANGRATINDMVFAPNQYMLVGMSGGTGTFSPTGVCQAVWVEN